MDNPVVRFVLYTSASSIAAILVCHLIERWKPLRAEPVPFSALALNIKLMLPMQLLRTIAALLAMAASVLAVNALGGGLVKIPDGGWAFVLPFIGYVLAMDLAEYTFHVAEHKWPPLWALHSLHHSDPDINASTTIRHHWMEQALKSVTVYPLVGLIFEVNALTLAAYSALSYYNYYPHMNIRGGLGKWSWLINTPQYHRLHHSTRPEDHDSRYCQLFPIWDVIFGTYKRPEPGDYPETGLDTGRKPAGVVQAIIWPLASTPPRSS